MHMTYDHCLLCPRMCGANRSAGELGFCGCPATALVAKTMIHKWEEPALAGSGGSGAIFFGGCIYPPEDRFKIADSAAIAEFYREANR